MLVSGWPDRTGLFNGVLVVANSREAMEEERVVVMNSVIDSSAELLLESTPRPNGRRPCSELAT